MLVLQRLFSASDMMSHIFTGFAMPRSFRFLTFSLALTALLAGLTLARPAHATYADPYAETRGNRYYSDPLEPFNRAVFGFNRFFDRVLLRPVAKGYQRLPGFVQTGTHNFLGNLLAPVSFLNEVLQGDLTGANITLWRFTTNTILGAGGLVDVADMVGRGPIPREDFGQTLGHYGVGTGPYLVLPLLGPSNLRDFSGSIVDIFTDPLNLYAIHDDQDWIPITRSVVGAIDSRARIMDVYDDLNNSVDPYSSFRSAYSQNRAYAVRDRVYEEGGAMDLYSMTESEY